MASQEGGSGGFIVIGASGDIGSHVARLHVEAGHRVLLASRPSEHLDRIATELDAPKYELDATNIADVASCFDQAVDQFGEIRGVVNCVGSVLLKPAHLTSEEEWQDTIATNLTSAFATVRAAGKTMKKSGGSVVLMSSAAARIGLPSHEAIAAAKAGIIGLAQAAAASYAPRGIRFNVVAPGLVRTKLTKKIWENERAAATSCSMHALGRMGEPEEVASLISWLLDPANSWVTGEVFSIDGGLGNVRLNQRPTAS
jgi:NAD(P)-dependent dehydrogenase (short-subunit alcohol dehydrogenase family)